MKINVNKTVQENILALILDANPTVQGLTLQKITIGTVSALTADPSGKNSQVTITAVKNRGFKGSQKIKFNRVAVNSNVTPFPSAISIDPTDTQAQRIFKVTEALGLIGTEVIVTATNGGDIGTPENEDDTSITVTVTPKPNSSLYSGDPLVIPLTVADTDIDLADVITNVNMNGFDPA